MSIKHLKPFIISDMKRKVQKVLNGKKKSVTLYFIRPNDVQEYIKSKRGEKTGMDANGFQYDYWIDFKLGTQEYTLSGDGYFSHKAIFAIKE